MKLLTKILILVLLSASTNLRAQKAGSSYAQSSVLATGIWFRSAITVEGVYRIDFSKLKELGLANPSNPKIFCSNDGQLSYYNSDPQPDDLKEVAIYTSTGNDGIFNEGDYLLFYGLAPGRFNFNKATKGYDYRKHNYSDTAFYFITSGTSPGKRIGEASQTAQAPNYYSTDSDVLFLYEKDDVNIIKSGRDWFQEIVTLRINPGFSGLLASESIRYRIRVAARASVPTQFRILEGQNTLKSIQVQPVNLFSSTGTYFQITDSTGSFKTESQSPQLDLKFYNNGESSADGYLDYIMLNGRKANSFSGTSLILRDSRSAAPGRITGFTVKSQNPDAVIWDISDIYNPGIIKYVKTDDNITFKSATDTLKTFFMFVTGNALMPVIKPLALKNQNLHSSPAADMVIVTHPFFLNYAEKLAGLHMKNSGLSSIIVTPGQIYNEFSGGIPDISAIRNFIRMKYLKQKDGAKPLRYLLLFGDGSVENKTTSGSNPNFIPTYQSANSNVVVSSFTSDDFYGLLEDGEGEADGTEDIGIGRLPVSDTVQAGIILSKINRYLDPEGMGDWKNVICITADDEDGNIHMTDAEGLSALLRDSVPSFNVDKIYLDAFRQTTSVNGQSYPDVNQAISDRINAGCLIFNYVGHGNESSLAHERVIKTEDINSWKNNNRLPLFITATCEFSRFDDIELNIATREISPKPSAGELTLLNKDGGAIALMSTTRVVYSAPNYTLNRNILDAAFDRDASGNPLRLGDIIRIAKNRSGSGPNKRNFSLLGDPALRLAYPWHGRVITDSVNRVHVSGSIDSLKALSLITVSGHIENINGTLASTFNGTVYPIVFDKPVAIKTLANDGGQIMEFKMRNNILFSGKTRSVNGRFSFTFLVPRDINYSFGQGMISYYSSDESNDMNGSFSNIVVGGFSNAGQSDTEGPNIQLFMNDTLFRYGGITDEDPRLLAIIEDIGGINTTGSGIGHDLAGYIDDDPAKTIILNNYFENDFDSYTRGRITYDLTGLSQGSHTITLKAWDNYNNSSEEKILFVVENGEEFILNDLLNYPNPFIDETSITAGHNRPESELDITINIYSLNGTIIKTIRTKVEPSGYSLPPIIWDGTGNGGSRAGRGVYIYRLTIRTNTGETASSSGRLVIL